MLHEYTLHLVVPKTGALTPEMLEWAAAHSGDPRFPEAYHPFRRLKPRTVARALLALDPSLIAEPGEGEIVILHYPLRDLGVSLSLHDRGIVVRFPLMGGSLVRIVLGIIYVYVRYLYEQAGFWSYDPQLKVISYADDYQSIDETAALLDGLLPRLLGG
ncbi:MAG: hypothetical protein SGJ24_05775 [Chloroflexota bacterium]|nr:hypothetical protein [Chloroflexota bacterium]